MKTTESQPTERTLRPGQRELEIRQAAYRISEQQSHLHETPSDQLSKLHEDGALYIRFPAQGVVLYVGVDTGDPAVSFCHFCS